MRLLLFIAPLLCGCVAPRGAAWNDLAPVDSATELSGRFLAPEAAPYDVHGPYAACRRAYARLAAGGLAIAHPDSLVLEVRVESPERLVVTTWCGDTAMATDEWRGRLTADGWYRARRVRYANYLLVWAYADDTLALGLSPAGDLIVERAGWGIGGVLIALPLWGPPRHRERQVWTRR